MAEHQPPHCTAARFDLALSYERELGLNFWDDAAPKGEGVFLTFLSDAAQSAYRLVGRFRAPFQASTSACSRGAG